MTGSNLERARAAWQHGLPDWVEALAEECDQAKSQRVVGEAIGYSASVVNQVLAGTYKGDLGRVEVAVRGRFLKAVLSCPVLGEISTADCLDHQRRPFTPTNPQRVQLWRSCRTCPNRRSKER